MSKKDWSSWAGIGVGAAAVGALSAYFMGHKEPPKTLEEYKSEAEKWEKQTGTAQIALLDMAVALSNVSRQLAEANENARLEKLRTDKSIRYLDQENVRLQKELAELKAAVPPATPPSSEGAT